MDCDDGDACTVEDQCSAGVCQGVPVDCDDGNEGTDDGCDPLNGCYWTNNTNPCNDGDACTADDQSWISQVTSCKIIEI